MLYLSPGGRSSDEDAQQEGTSARKALRNFSTTSLRAPGDSSRRPGLSLGDALRSPYFFKLNRTHTYVLSRRQTSVQSGGREPKPAFRAHAAAGDRRHRRRDTCLHAVSFSGVEFERSAEVSRDVAG